MVSRVQVFLNSQQRKKLLARARKGGTSLEGEVRRSIDQYLDLRNELENEEMASLVQEISTSMGSTIAKLDKALALLAMFKTLKQ